MSRHVATERQSSFTVNDTTTWNIFSARTKLGLVSPPVSWNLRNTLSYIDVNAGTAVAQWLRYCATVGDRGSAVVKVLRYSGGPQKHCG
jgi:hypothetical protein